jgi:hypothetical protein
VNGHAIEGDACLRCHTRAALCKFIACKLAGDAGQLTFHCNGCSLSVQVTLHTRESERAREWYMRAAPNARCPSCGDLLDLEPATDGAGLHAAHYWWASFTTVEQRALGGDAARWWSRLKPTRRQELRDKMKRGDTER